MARRKELSPKQAAFLKAYLSNGKNSVKAWFASRPDSKMSETTARSKASQMLREPKIAAELDKAEDKVKNKIAIIADKYAITQERIIEEIAKIAFSRPDQVQKWGPDGLKVIPSEELTDDAMASVAEVQEMRGLHGTVMKVKQYDKLRALVDLGKSIGMFQPEKDTGPKMAVQFIISKD